LSGPVSEIPNYWDLFPLYRAAATPIIFVWFWSFLIFLLA